MARPTTKPAAVDHKDDRLPTGIADSGSLDGTQAIRRAVAILRLVATHRSPGASLANICDQAQLPRSTTHRILKCLVSEGLLSMSDRDSFYTIGPLASELSLGSLSGHHSTSFWSALLPRIAMRTGHTSYLMARTGREAVCLQRAEGHASFRAAPVEVGQRRPLGVGAGGIALLAQFDESEIEDFTKSLGNVLRTFKSLTPEIVLADTLDAKRQGYAVSRGRVFSDTAGIGIALDDDSPSRLAVSITCPASFINEEGPDKVAEMMRQEIERFSELAASQTRS
jgi:DNA-binding IclR family transcriptional regulator